MVCKPGPYRVLVTGSRNWTDEQALRCALDHVLDSASVRPGPLDVVVVHGDCPTGADFMADRWGRDKADIGVVVETHPADWGRHGRAAGPLRNARMVGLGADLCLAFPLGFSRGTRDCMRRAQAAGIEVRTTTVADLGGQDA